MEAEAEKQINALLQEWHKDALQRPSKNRRFYEYRLRFFPLLGPCLIRILRRVMEAAIQSLVDG